MASLATVLAHLCIATNIAKPAPRHAFGNVYDKTREMIAGSAVNPSLIELDGFGRTTSVLYRKPRPRGLYGQAIRNQLAAVENL
jgi:hypothetical protein